MFSLALLLSGFLAGRVSAVWACSMIVDSVPTGLRRCRGCGVAMPLLQQLAFWRPISRCGMCSSRDVVWPVWVSIIMSGLFLLLGWLLVSKQCQSVTEVRPSLELWLDRLPFQLAFVFLLTTATVTDLLDYVIPDAIVIPGALLAMCFATLSGELQIIHVWVNWDYEFVSLYGPYLPEWMKNHQHLHGFIWSLSGLITGAGLMWIARASAQAILGVPAIGFGDVTLMAMIGAFMGWQPVLCVLAIAPLAGIILGPAVRILSGRNFVAFGPYLCIAAFIVLCIWKLLWEDLRLRIVFSHWPSVAGMVAGAFAAFCCLLFALRVFRATPADRLR